jgi:PIN domain nuclease of toxin-antitoxin system
VVIWWYQEPKRIRNSTIDLIKDRNNSVFVSDVVTSKRKERHDHQKTTLTRQTISLFLDTNRPDFSDTQADPKGFKNFCHRTF